MKIGALQSAYLPWIGFFDQVAHCDLFIIFDDLQYTKKDWRARNRIKSPQGRVWLTVPVQSAGVLKKSIDAVEIAGKKWSRQHWQTLKNNYARAPFFDQYADFFQQIYQSPWKKLAPLNRAIIDGLLKMLKIETKVLYSAENKIEKGYQASCQQPDPTERIIYLCRRFQADLFLEGRSGQNYIYMPAIEQAGLKIQFQDYIHPVYPQLFGEFLPYLAIVDLLFNCGDDSLKILKG